MTEHEKRLHRCCFAGHRPEGIQISPSVAKLWLRDQITRAITSGYTTFLGMNPETHEVLPLERVLEPIKVKLDGSLYDKMMD